MNILLASAEVAPYAKTGGLADITGALPVEWKKAGENPIVVMPKYGSIDVEKYNLKKTDYLLVVPMGFWEEYAGLWHGKLPGSDVDVYFIEHDIYFNRDGIYGDPHEYGDNDRRFIFFSRAVFSVCEALNFAPDIIQAHDFHAAFSLAFLKSFYRNHPLFSKTAGVYTIHNLAYQGWFNPQRAMEFSGFGMKEFYPGSWFEHKGNVNAMKVGIMFADKVTTVSPTYSQEIRWNYYGEGIDDILNLRGADLIGILNGVYYDDWSPETDKHLFHNYNLDNFHTKNHNKADFLSSLGIEADDRPDLPLVGMVTRLTEQKGIDLIVNKLENHLFNEQYRFVMLGTGDYNYVNFFNYIKWKYPKLALINIGYNNELAHRIIGCSDFIFMPSRFEPCGLTQMYALSYGTIPIVRMTGGLADTVKEYSTDSMEGTGFTFWQYNAEYFDHSIDRALSIYYNKLHWDNIRKNAMKQRFPSENSAKEYIQVFEWALEKIGVLK